MKETKKGYNPPPKNLVRPLSPPPAPPNVTSKAIDVNIKVEGQPISEEKIELYRISVECRNCGRPNYNTDEAYQIDIPRGIESSKVFADMPCQFCGCKTLQRVK